jgi:hypothetical protein
MTKARLMLFTAFLAFWPTQAQAANGWWAWLEELSGPGPFKGEVYSFTLGCDGPEGWMPCAAGNSKTKHTIVLRLGHFVSDPDTPRFKDLPVTDADNQGKVGVMPVTGLYLFRLHRSLDVGPGAGFMRVSGDGFSSFYRFVLTPLSVSFTPLDLCGSESNWKRVLRLELDTSYVPQGFKGKDFGNTRTSFDSGPDFLTRGAVVIDIGALIGGAVVTLSNLHR